MEDILPHAFEVLDPAEHGFLSKEELIKQRTKEGERFSQEDTEEMLSATTAQNRIQSLQGLSNNDSDEIKMLEKTLARPWTARRANQPTLKGISSEYSLEGLMLNLKLQYFGHLMRRAEPLEKTCCWERLKEGKEWGDRG